MYFGHQANIKDGENFKITAIIENGEQSTYYKSNEGIALIYDKNQDKLTTVGAISTEHLEKAAEHIMKALLNSYKEKNETFIGVITDYCAVLDKLDEIITTEEDGVVKLHGSLDGVHKKRF